MILILILIVNLILHTQKPFVVKNITQETLPSYQGTMIEFNQI